MTSAKVIVPVIIIAVIIVAALLSYFFYFSKTARAPVKTVKKTSSAVSKTKVSKFSVNNYEITYRFNATITARNTVTKTSAREILGGLLTLGYSSNALKGTQQSYIIVKNLNIKVVGKGSLKNITLIILTNSTTRGKIREARVCYKVTIGPSMLYSLCRSVKVNVTHVTYLLHALSRLANKCRLINITKISIGNFSVPAYCYACKIHTIVKRKPLMSAGPLAKLINFQGNVSALINICTLRKIESTQNVILRVSAQLNITRPIMQLGKMILTMNVHVKPVRISTFNETRYINLETQISKR